MAYLEFTIPACRQRWSFTITLKASGSPTSRELDRRMVEVKEGGGLRYLTLRVYHSLVEVMPAFRRWCKRRYAHRRRNRARGNPISHAATVSQRDIPQSSATSTG